MATFFHDILLLLFCFHPQIANAARPSMRSQLINIQGDICLQQKYGTSSTNHQRIIVVGGTSTSGKPIKMIEEYYPAENSSQLACHKVLPHLPKQMTEHRDFEEIIGGVVINHQIVIVGGSIDGRYNPRHANSTAIYDFLEYSWKKGPDTPTHHWAGATALIRSSKLCICGDQERFAPKNVCECLDKALKQWKPMKSMPVKRSQFAAIGYLGNIYVIGGYGRNAWKTAHVFYSKDNAWKPLPIMKYAKKDLAATALNGHIYACGGNDGKSATDTCQKYRISQGEWLDMPPMLVARVKFTLTTLGGKIYAIGGETREGYATAIVECYDPHLQRWTKVFSLKTARIGGKGVVYGEFEEEKQEEVY